MITDFFPFQAKAIIISPDNISVYCTASGKALWKKKAEPEVAILGDDHHFLDENPLNPFLTKDIAGYLVKERIMEKVETSDDEEGYEEVNVGDDTILRIYETKSGELIATERLTHYCDNLLIKFRGRCLCYVAERRIQAVVVEGRKAKRYEFPIPIDHFIKTRQLASSVMPESAGLDLLGFLGKTNILIGNLWLRDSNGSTFTMLFTLNLDAATAAPNEQGVNLAFSIPSACKSLGSPKNDFQPIYRTDQRSKSVELIGVMRENNIRSPANVTTIENGFFVTEMECKPF